MTTQNKIVFIINPKSGVLQKNNIPALINSIVSSTLWETHIKFTDAPHHATELANEAAQKNFKVIVAVGGDGSVNETGAGIVGSESALGIIPCGSGNGMARHLKIPVNLNKALQLLNTGKQILIDSLSVNNRFCIGTFGTGFDAHIAHLFAKAKTRGYATYVKLILAEFYKYKSIKINLEIDSNPIVSDNFMLTFANSSQFGNNAVIAPFANVQDGKLDITMINNFPAVSAASIIWRLLNNNLHTSKYFAGYQANNVKIIGNKPILAHIDGEAVTLNGDIDINLLKDSIKMWVA